MMKHTLAAIFACMLSACATGVEPDRAEQPLEPTAEYFLVWWSVEEGGHTTALVKSDSGGDMSIVAEGDGLFIAADSALWSWEEREVPTTQTECGCLMEAETNDTEPSCKVSRDVKVAEIVEVDGERSFTVNEGAGTYDGEYDPNPSPIGSSGPFLMSVNCAYGYFCGAHGNVECSYHAWNLEAGTELSTDELVVPLSKADQIALLNEEPRDEVINEEILMGLVSVRPSWSSEGAVSLDASYAAAACYACSDGEWSSYTVTARHDDARAKVELEAAPPAVVEVWNTSTDSRGWSRLPAAEVERASSLL
jgi:hypothetical protein